MLDHHDRGQCLDDLERLRGAVPLLLLLLLVQVTWEGPESIRVNCGDYIPLEGVTNKVRLQQGSKWTKELIRCMAIKLNIEIVFKPCIQEGTVKLEV